MHKIDRAVLLPYRPAQMFDLVADVERYPDFMPWCGGAQVLARDNHGMQASITIALAGLSQRFTTRNTHDYPRRIDLELVDGPFSRLVGHWRFEALGGQGDKTDSDASGCKVCFTLEYAFASRTLEALVGPVFNRIAGSFIDSFTRRAQACYGG